MTTLSTSPLVGSASDDLDHEIAALVREALQHPAVQHPFLMRFARGACRDQEAALRQYAVQFAGWVAWVPHCWTAVLSRLQSPGHHSVVQRSLARAQGQLDDDDCEALRRVGISPRGVLGQSQGRLFERFACALGIEGWELAEPQDAAWQWRTQLLQFLGSASAAHVVGAMVLGEELTARSMHKQLLKGMLELGTLRHDALVFFELQCAVDERQRRQLLTVAKELAAVPGGLAELRFGMLTALQLRCDFWDQLYVGVLGSDLPQSRSA